MVLKNTYQKLSTVLSVVAAVIIVLLPFHAFITTWLASNFGHFDLFRVWKELLLLILTPAFLVLVLVNQKIKKWLASSVLVRFIALYALMNFGFGFWALASGKVNSQALVYGLIINLRFLGFFLICAVLAASNNFLKTNWKKLIIGPALVVICFGLIQQFVLPRDFLRHFGYSQNTIPAYQTVDANPDYRRLQSTLRGANPLGAYLVLVIPLLGVSFNRRKTFKYLSVAGGLVVLFYSYSRSAYIGIVLTFIGLWLIVKRRILNSKKIWITTVAALILIAGIILGLHDSQTVQDTVLHTSNGSTSSVSSNQARASAIKDAAKDVLQNPLGGGTGTAGPASLRSDHPARIAENYFLQIGQELGLLGLTVFVIINVLLAKELWQNKNNKLNKILLASLLGITFVNLLSHAWADDTLSYLWWGLAGIAIAPAIIAQKAKHKHG